MYRHCWIMNLSIAYAIPNLAELSKTQHMSNLLKRGTEENMDSQDRTISTELMNEAHSNRNARQSEGSNLLVVLVCGACAFSSRAKLRMRQAHAQIFSIKRVTASNGKMGAMVSNQKQWTSKRNGRQPHTVLPKRSRYHCNG